MDYSIIFQRRHPIYRKCRSAWLRSRDAYAGGASYIDQALLQHVSEVDVEFLERRARAYYFNYPRKIARLITQYVLASDPVRDGAPAEISEDFSRTGLRANEVMRQFSTLLNIYGKAWILVDVPNFAGKVDAGRRAEEKLRPYAVALSPLSVPDWSVAEDGTLAWAIVEEPGFDNASPYADARSFTRRRLWTREAWRLFESDANGGVRLVAEGKHNLGKVPLVRAEECDGYAMGAGHWFEDVVRISDAILNNESEAQMNVIKQMFGLLVISENFARGARPQRRTGADNEPKFSHILARSAAIWESSDESGISRYISPKGADTDTIRSENQSLKSELFDVIGLTLMRETHELQSAASKAWDHQLVRQFLTNRVDLLEQAETETWKLMHAYDASIAVPDVIYNRDFAILDLKEAIEGILSLQNIEAGKEFRREIARTAVTMLGRYQKIAPERIQQIFEEISAMDCEVKHE